MDETNTITVTEDIERLTNLGLEHFSDEKYENATNAMEQALHLRIETLGEYHPDIVKSYSDLAYVSQGTNQSKIINCYEKILEITIHISGKNSLDVARVYVDLAENETTTESQLDYYEKALNIRQRILGRRHVSLAYLYHCIGWCWFVECDFQKALSSLHKALDIALEKIGGEDPKSGDIHDYYQCISQIYFTMDGCEEEAYYYEKKAIQTYFKQAWFIEQKQQEAGEYPSKYDEYSSVHFRYKAIEECKSIGQWYSHKYPDKALVFFHTALALLLRKDSSYNLNKELMEIYWQLGNIYGKQKQYKKAVHYCEKALHTQPDTVQRQTRNAIRDYARNDSQEALSCLKKATDTIRKKIDDYQCVGVICRDAGMYDKSITYSDKARQLAEEVFGLNHCITAIAQQVQGDTYIAKGDYGEAISLYARASGIYTDALGEDHPESITAHIALGDVHTQNGTIDSASFCYESALYRSIQLLEEDPFDTLGRKIDTARYHLKEGRKCSRKHKRAEFSHFKQGIDMLRKHVSARRCGSTMMKTKEQTTRSHHKDKYEQKTSARHTQRREIEIAV